MNVEGGLNIYYLLGGTQVELGSRTIIIGRSLALPSVSARTAMRLRPRSAATRQCEIYITVSYAARTTLILISPTISDHSGIGS